MALSEAEAGQVLDPEGERRAVLALRPDPQNRRAHGDRNRAMTVEALRQLGAARSIVIDEADVILAGNGVQQAAIDAGITSVRVIESDGTELIAVRRRGLTPEQKRALAIYDNRTSELAEWNPEQLKGDLDAGLAMAPFFFDAELRGILGGAAREGRTDPDAVPPERATTIQRGDLFELGAHRLLCGDSTSADDFARLMGASEAQMIFTDPPYGVGYDGGMKKRELLANDQHGTAIYERALPLLARAVDAAAPLYLWYADGAVGGTAAAAATAAIALAGYVITAQIVWSKNHAQFMSPAHYKVKHEPCYYAHKRGQTPRWFGPNNEVTVWEADRASSNDFHPTQKPVALAVRAIGNSTSAGQLVIDGFGGGGTTLIACEQVQRAAVLVEIEPQYCQVIIDRWEAFAGGTARRVGSV